MSISSQIVRLQQAKADLTQALSDQGINVPANVLLDEYADYVRQIRSEQVVTGQLTIQQTGTNSIPIDGALVVASAMVPASGVKLVVTPDSPSHYYGADGIVYDSSQNQFNIVVSSPGIVGFVFEYIIVSTKQ